MSTETNYEEEPESLGAVYIKDPKKKRKCPLCNQNLHLYNLNYEEMMLMCENIDCDYPFGYEPLQVVKNENELRQEYLPATDDFFMYPIGGVNPTIESVTTVSQTNSVMSDPEIFNFAEDTDSSQELLSVRLSKASNQRKLKKHMSIEMETKLNNIKLLNTEIMKMEESNVKNIKKEKWLHNLKSWQKQSGKRLLTEDEIKVLKKNEPEFTLGELKISLNSDAGIPSVNIEVLTTTSAD